MGATLLHAVELDDWIAGSVDEYVEIARRNASDLAGLSRLRSRLRDVANASELADSAGYTRALEDAYCAMLSCENA
jgi:predicted O-linked N-acetylglucosamine transferase (SPINDLY family)